ncbi:uncharacterized protein VTP21DRAFT_5505 [Calcarisporiella thermophila]|uniref:uncharacterized protein n=1 Tax=Calcarisporiella thermophila TaxID=911321 RepID=UPI003743DED5
MDKREPKPGVIDDFDTGTFVTVAIFVLIVSIGLILCYRRAQRLIPNGSVFALRPTRRGTLLRLDDSDVGLLHDEEEDDDPADDDDRVFHSGDERDEREIRVQVDEDDEELLEDDEVEASAEANGDDGDRKRLARNS